MLPLHQTDINDWCKTTNSHQLWQTVCNHFSYHLKLQFDTNTRVFWKASGDMLLLSITIVDLSYLSSMTRRSLCGKDLELCTGFEPVILVLQTRALANLANRAFERSLHRRRWEVYLELCNDVFFMANSLNSEKPGAHSQIRTEDLRFTRPLLWPTELSERIRRH